MTCLGASTSLAPMAACSSIPRDWLSQDLLRRRFKRAEKAAGLAELRLHDLRHSFATLAVQVFPLSDVQQMLGHASVTTTAIYLHHVPRHDQADRLSQLVAETDVVHPVVHRTTDSARNSERLNAPGVPGNTGEPRIPAGS